MDFQSGNSDKPRATITTSGKVGKSRGKIGRSRLRPMVGMVAVGSEADSGEVSIESRSYPFLSWAEVELLTKNMLGSDKT